MSQDLRQASGLLSWVVCDPHNLSGSLSSTRGCTCLPHMGRRVLVSSSWEGLSCLLAPVESGDFSLPFLYLQHTGIRLAAPCCGAMGSLYKSVLVLVLCKAFTVSQRMHLYPRAKCGLLLCQQLWMCMLQICRALVRANYACRLAQYVKVLGLRKLHFLRHCAMVLLPWCSYLWVDLLS